MSYKIGECTVIDDTRNICNIANTTSNNVTISSELNIPSGTTAQRPGTPSTGSLRYNTDNAKPEVYNGSDWADVGGGASACPYFVQTPFGQSWWDHGFSYSSGRRYNLDSAWFGSNRYEMRATDERYNPARNCYYPCNQTMRRQACLYDKVTGDIKYGPLGWGAVCECQCNCINYADATSIIAVTEYGMCDYTERSDTSAGAATLGMGVCWWAEHCSCGYGAVCIKTPECASLVSNWMCFCHVGGSCCWCCPDRNWQFITKGHCNGNPGCNGAVVFPGTSCCGIVLSIKQNIGCTCVTPQAEFNITFGWKPEYIYDCAYKTASQCMCYRYGRTYVQNGTCPFDRVSSTFIDYDDKWIYTVGCRGCKPWLNVQKICCTGCTDQKDWRICNQVCKHLWFCNRADIGGSMEMSCCKEILLFSKGKLADCGQFTGGYGGSCYGATVNWSSGYSYFYWMFNCGCQCNCVGPSFIFRNSETGCVHAFWNISPYCGCFSLCMETFETIHGSCFSNVVCMFQHNFCQKKSKYASTCQCNFYWACQSGPVFYNKWDNTMSGRIAIVNLTNACAFDATGMGMYTVPVTSTAGKVAGNSCFCWCKCNCTDKFMGFGGGCTSSTNGCMVICCCCLCRSYCCATNSYNCHVLGQEMGCGYYNSCAWCVQDIYAYYQRCSCSNEQTCNGSGGPDLIEFE